MSSAFIKKQIKLYKSLKPCYSKALEDTVHFTSEGLHHLLYYRRRPRNHDQKHYRASLISHIVDVITNATTTVKTIKSKKPLVIIWILEAEVEGNDGKQVIKVILRKQGVGKVMFLSTMRKRYLDKTKI